MKKLIELKLKILAKIILKKYKPEIIGITGSVGKTSSKEAIYAVLKERFSVRQSAKNYNNELGLPLAIIGEKAQGHNIIGWAAVFLHALSLILKTDKNYPKTLILEMGVDKPNDMDYLIAISKPDIAVLTMIGTVHAKNFSSRNELKKEKIKLIESAKNTGWSIINYDNKETREAINRSKAKVLTFGFSDKADVSAVEVKHNYETSKQLYDGAGLNFKIRYKGNTVPVMLPKILSPSMIFAALAATAVGIAKGMNLIEIAEKLKHFQAPKGRLNIIHGIKDTMLIDDTYNSEPESAAAAIKMLGNLTGKTGIKKYAVLGDMLELGRYSVESHRRIGKLVHGAGIDKLAVVGERSRDTKRAAIEAGMSEDDVYEFKDAESAGLFLQNRIKTGDQLLIKGSQGMRMEKITKELMADPLLAKDLLVRQDEGWA